LYWGDLPAPPDPPRCKWGGCFHTPPHPNMLVFSFLVPTPPHPTLAFPFNVMACPYMVFLVIVRSHGLAVAPRLAVASHCDVMLFLWWRSMYFLPWFESCCMHAVFYEIPFTSVSILAQGAQDPQRSCSEEVKFMQPFAEFRARLNSYPEPCCGFLVHTRPEVSRKC
jgi:hypothetical protein